MIILHGSWLPQTEHGPAAFFLWAETAERLHPSQRGRPVSVRSHPFQAPVESLIEALALWAPSRPLSLDTNWPGTIRVQALLPSQGRRPLPSPELVPSLPYEDRKPGTGKAEPTLATWALEGLPLPPTDALAILAVLPESESDLSSHGPGCQLGQDLRFWSLMAKFALELLARQCLLPSLIPHGPQQFRAGWTPVLDGPQDQQRLGWLIRAMPPACRALRPKGTEETPAPSTLVQDFLNGVMDAAVRQWAGPAQPRRGRRPSQPGSRWAEALWAAAPIIDASPSQLTGLYEAWRTWTGALHAAADVSFRLCFRLEPPEVTEADPEKAQASPGENWVLRFFLQPADDLSLLVPAAKVWREWGEALDFLHHRFDQPQERLLAGLGLASHLFPPLEQSLRSARPEECALTTREAYAFLREAAPLLEQSGFGVLVPPWWAKRGARLGLRARLSSKHTPSTDGPGILSMDAIVSYNWQLALGDEPLTWEEFHRLAALKQELVQVRGQWVELDPTQVEAAIRFWETHRDGEVMRLGEALQLGLGQEATVAGLPVTGVEAEGWMAGLLDQLRDSQALALLSLPQGFVGQLRPYQVRGYSWLAFLRRWGLGACLADDMGLGKTIQAIALLLHDKEQGASHKPVLIICPTSVATNWQHEVARFSPTLRVWIHHGADRASGEAFADLTREHDLIISTYALARRDEDTLGAVEWSGIILDEAQNIKNPSAKQSQAVRRLSAGYRVALTGTPVENRLSELWSIMEFLNPGYLGSQKEFHSRFAVPIERYREEAAVKGLQSVVRPFILRWVKTDPTIIQDLPEKMEMKVYCTLTPEQATLYEAVVRDALEQIDETEGIQRRGLVLATLLKLKQVCNHPAQFLGDSSALPGRSGKLARLTEMLEEVLAVQEKALVFTQFAVMGEMLQSHLQEAFGREALFLHGGTPRTQRGQMVSRFQDDRHGPPIFVLSLKAGGLGLNLTGANHVFHFDRWWNPAVENQATDRAFRIGQARDVWVHKFICAGTLEERIDDLIESKKELADMAIGTGEGWLTELSTDELRGLLTLRWEAVGESSQD